MLVEEFVTSRRFEFWLDTRLYIEQGLLELLATYDALGVRRAPLNGPLDHSTVTAAKTATSDASFQAALAAAVAENPLVPFGTCHGDLLPSNLCISQGRLVFLDWGKSFDGPLIADLLRLPFKFPGQTRRLLEATLLRFGTAFTLSPDTMRHQMTAYTARRIATNPGRTGVFLKCVAAGNGGSKRLIEVRRGEFGSQPCGKWRIRAEWLTITIFPKTEVGALPRYARRRLVRYPPASDG